MRRATAMRAAAWGVVAAGLVVPVVRRKAKLPAPVVSAVAAAAPVALCVALPRTRARDVATCCLQMYAYTATYKMPHDDPAKLEARVHLDYPWKIDRVIGLGQVPNVRLQRLLAKPGEVSKRDAALVWVHWIWFFVPHSTVAYKLVRKPDQFPRSAVMTYAVFDLGLIGYWGLPTAPPWYASEQGRLPELRDGQVAVRRLMVEHGQAFWKGGWGPLYSVFGGNPLAAMPSLHFATSLMAAHLLSEAGPVEGALGWTYALTLGFALVYLGEHYVVDLLAGAALTEGVRRLGPHAAPALQAFSRTVQRLEARAAM